ncbi:polyprenyl synthetase family protein, partial [Streptomyces nigra]
MTETQHRPAGVPLATEPPEGRGTVVTGRAGPPGPADTPEAAVILERTRASVDPEMRAAVESLPPSMRRIAGYHFGWTDPDGTPASGGAGGVRGGLPEDPAARGPAEVLGTPGA